MKKRITPTDLFLSLLALMLICVSFLQTWDGLEQIFGGSSMIIALVLSLLLLFLLWQLRTAKSKGTPKGGLLGIYTFIAFFCFIANFNALYTRLMKTDIYKNELKSIKEKFNDLEINIESKLNYTVSDVKTRQEIRGEIDELKIQINDHEKGIGPEARKIINRIEKKIGNGKKITPLTPTGNTPSDYEDLASRMEEQINEIIYNLSPEENALKSDIHNAASNWNKEIQSLLHQKPNEINDKAQGQIEIAQTEYNKLGNRAQKTIGEEKIKFTPVHSKTHEVGKLGFAFKHAISNFGMYQFVVLMGCILLDFGIMIIILLVPDENSGTNQRNSGSVLTTKRSGKILIPNN